VRAQIAPGVKVAEDLRTMDARIFRAQPMLAGP
jgi:acyl CoA:acetate/3-ketoacid CoA transferase